MNSTKQSSKLSSFFNPKLFLQAFKQLKIVGIISLICAFVYAIILPLILYFGNYDVQSDYMEKLELAVIPTYFFPLLLLIYFITPLLCFMIFGFLHKRNGSDFYHSIPVKRCCLFFTFVSAVISWIFIIISFFTILLITTLSIFSNYVILNIPNILIFDINILISCILVTAVIALACSITGTLFSNIATSVTIFAIPRLLITLFCCLIESANPSVGWYSMSLLTRPDCNIAIYGLSFFSGVDNASPFLTLNYPTVYTLILGIIYLMAGCIAFSKRQSETAEKAYAYKSLKFIFRMLIGYLVTLVAVALLFETIVYEYDIYIIPYIIIFAFALISIFIYEIANTKSFKQGIKSLVTAPLLIVLDLITVAILIIVNNSITDEKLDSKNTDYVYISGIYTLYTGEASTNDSYEDYLSYTYDDQDFYFETTSDPLNSCYSYGYLDDIYLNAKLSSTKITNPEVIDFIIDVYNGTCPTYERTDEYDYGKIVLSVTFDDTFTDKTRMVYFTNVQYEHLMYMLLNDEALVQSLSDMPAYDSNSAINCEKLTISQAKQVYKTLLREISEMSSKELLDFIIKPQSSDCTDCVGSFVIDTCVNGEYMNLVLPITSMTPDSYVLYLQYINKNNKENFIDCIEYFNSSKKYYDGYLYFAYSQISDNGIANPENTMSYAISFDETGRLNQIDSIASEAITFISSEDAEKYSNYNNEDYYLCYVSVDICTYEDKLHFYPSKADSKYGCGYFIIPKDSDIFGTLKNDKAVANPVNSSTIYN